jgi:hypothetical protein
MFILLTYAKQKQKEIAYFILYSIIFSFLLFDEKSRLMNNNKKKHILLIEHKKIQV